MAKEPKYPVEPFRQGYKIVDVDKYVPRVTTVLGVLDKPGLKHWFKREALGVVREELQKCVGGPPVKISDSWIEDFLERANREPERQKDEAADIGKRAHAAIFAKIKKEPVVITEDISQCVSGYEEWLSKCGIDVEDGEIVVGSKQYGYAGTLDAIGRRKDGKRVLLDWKSSREIRTEYAYQVSAYVFAYEEMFGELINEAWVIRFPKHPRSVVDGIPDPAWVPFESKKVASIDSAFKSFLGCLHLYHSQKINWFQEQIDGR